MRLARDKSRFRRFASWRSKQAIVLQSWPSQGEDSSNIARNASEISIKRKMKIEVLSPFYNDIESKREVRFPFSDTLTGNCRLKNESLKFRFPIAKGNGKRKWKFVFRPVQYRRKTSFSACPRVSIARLFSKWINEYGSLFLPLRFWRKY